MQEPWFSARKAEGYEMAIIGIAPFHAPIARAQMQAVLDAGMRLEVYGAPDVTTDERFAQVIEIAKPYNPERYWVDVEGAGSYHPDAAGIRTAVGICEQAGVKHGIYSAKYVWDANDLPSDWAYLPLWNARYDENPEIDFGFIPYGGWTRPTIKQFSDKGHEDGVSFDKNTVRG